MFVSMSVPYLSVDISVSACVLFDRQEKEVK